MQVGRLMLEQYLLRLHGTADLRQRYFVQCRRAGRADQVLLLQLENRVWYVAMARYVRSTTEF